MKITVNGEAVDVADAETVAELIARYQLPPQSVVVEYNGRPLNRREWPEQPLNHGDRIEFVRIVAGG